MIFIGLLTHEQKQKGYFVCQDEDFIYLFHRADGDPRIIAIFDYETATVKKIREAANMIKPCPFCEFYVPCDKDSCHGCQTFIDAITEINEEALEKLENDKEVCYGKPRNHHGKTDC